MTGSRYPLGWSSKRLKYVATYNDEVLAESTDQEKDIDYVEISGVSLARGIETITRMTFGEAPSSARRKVRSGDILISTVRTYLKAITRVNEPTSKMIVTTGFCVVRPNDYVDNGYLCWAVMSEPFVSEAVARSVGVTYPSINASELVTIEVPLPPFDTQKRIARFLDKKTARVDGLIEKKKELLERLAEKRQTLITQAFTQGLNPASPLRNSEFRVNRGTPRDAEASGRNLDLQTPEDWTHATIGKFCEVKLGKMLQKEPVSEKDEFKPYLRAINIGRKGLDLSYRFNMWIRPQEIDSLRLKKGDVLVSEGGDVGRAAIFNAEGEFYFQNAINRIRPDYRGKVEPDFIYYWFAFLKSSGYVQMICNIATIPHFTAEKVKATPFAFPPLNTQRQIVSYLDEKTSHIDQVIERIEESIVLLEEYRTALITAGVNGQITELR